MPEIVFDLSIPPLALAALRFGDWQLAQPAWLFVLLALPFIFWLRRHRPTPVLLIPGAAAWAAPRPPASLRWPVWLATFAFILLSLGLARPQRVDDRTIIRGEGYDLILALDLSASMYAEDSVRDGQRINRLEALKPILEAFVLRRPQDRIGFVAFSGRAYTLAPLTHDHAWLAKQIARLRIGLIEDGTAIGDGIGLALTRLARAREEDGTKRAGSFVILLTDGAHNRGELTPSQAVALAQARQVPIYTIGVGQDGLVPFPMIDESGRRIGTQRVRSDLDTGALREIADSTGGKFFRADDPSTAAEAFAAIDRAQKISFDQTTHLVATELYPWPTSAASVLLLLALPALLRRSP